MKKHLLQLSLAACLGLPAAALAQGTYLSAPDGNPTNALTVANGGNIGIGTATPSEKLHVQGNALVQGDILMGGGNLYHGGSGLQFVNSSGGGHVSLGGVPNSDIAYLGALGSNGFSSASEFIIAGYGLGYLPRVQVHANSTYISGNVGIGTATPQAPLHIKGSTANATILVEGNQSAMKHADSTGAHRFLTGLRDDVSPNLNFVFYSYGGDWTFQGGNVGIGTTTPQAKLDVAGKINCTVLELTSDRNQKQDSRPVSAAEVLAKVARLPLSTWAYTNSPNVRHLGPMAQDFQAAFHLGESDKHIGAGDGIGVALAAIQGLHELVQEKNSEITALQR